MTRTELGKHAFRDNPTVRADKTPMKDTSVFMKLPVLRSTALVKVMLPLGDKPGTTFELYDKDALVMSQSTKHVRYQPRRFVSSPDAEVVNVINNIRVETKQY